MSEPCEVIEDVAQGSNATSVTLASTFVSVAQAAAVLVLGLSLGAADTGEGTDVVDAIVHLALYDEGDGADSVTPFTTAVGLLTDTARAGDGLSVAFPVSVEDSAEVSDTVSAALPPVNLTDVAEGSDVVLCTYETGLADAAIGADALQVDQSVEVEDAADALAALLVQQSFTVVTQDAAEGVDTWVPTVFVGYTYVDVGQAADALTTQTALQAALNDSADGDDYLESPFGTGMAWVMNTETAAMSWFDDYPFDSIVQLEEFQGSEHSGEDILMSGPDGLYALGGDRDEPLGVPVAFMSELRWGFTDFGDPSIKRTDAAHFAVDRAGVYTAEFVVPDAVLGTHSYTFRSPQISAPHTVRVVPGRGLFGRYWQVAFRSATPFEVSDASIDVATSKRRL